MAQLQIFQKGSYHSRFQVKWRRRREGKTDYFSRRRLLHQDKRKYNSPKYRIVVRISKRNIICQFVQSRLQGDHVLNAIYSKNLKFLGIQGGQTSFSSSYLIGFLLAKRVVSKNFLPYQEGKTKKKTPNAVLDIGLRRVTTGNKVFSVLSGIVDGGINVPHNEKRFPGYNSDGEFNPEILNQRIKGKHVEEYMEILKEEDYEKYQKHFSKLIEFGMEIQEYPRSFDKAQKEING